MKTMESLVDLHASFGMAWCPLWSVFQGNLASNMKALEMDWIVQKAETYFWKREKKEIFVNLTLWVCGIAAKHVLVSVRVASFTSPGLWRSASLHSVNLPCVFLARWRHHLY